MRSRSLGSILILVVSVTGSPLSARGAQVPDDSESRMNAETLSEASGLLAAPGDYSATLAKEVGGEITTFGPPVRFEVVPLRGGALPGSSYAEAAAFWRSYENSVRTASAVNRTLGGEMNRVEATKTALSRATAAPGDLDERLNRLRTKLQGIAGY